MPFLVVVLIGLNLYFTDDRLKSTVMPYVDDAVGRQVNVESMSLTFFSTFPQPGLSIQQMHIPGETESDTLAALDELVASVKLFSLMGNQIEVSEISLRNPRFTYRVHPDGSSNIDFLMESDTTEAAASGSMAINIPHFNVTGGNFGYHDLGSQTKVQFDDLNADISLRYANLIQSTVDANLGGLSASVGDTVYLNKLPLSLQQQSTINMENETMNLEQGTLSIRGLALNLSGSISDWSNKLTGDLAFSSSSDNFGELLRLVPAEYQQYTEGLETRGTLAIDGTLRGALASEDLPSFDASITVTNGYLKNPDLPQPIQNIQLSATAANNLLSVDKLTATAGENNLQANGTLENPLEDSGDFSIDVDANINLATVRSFYDISQFDIEQMGGQLVVNGQAQGNRQTPEQATFDAVVKLSGGTLKYAGVNKAVENITVDAKANQQAITINNMELQAAANTFSMNGTVNQPLDEAQRSVDLQTNLDFDLATIKEFYPIDEDTLSMRGQLTAKATLNGKANRIEQAVQSGQLSLREGYINHKSLGKPIEDLTLESSLNGPTLSITKASFRTGENNLSATGSITDYLSDSRSLDLKINGKAVLNEIRNYYDLSPTITTLTGQANMNLRARGPINDPANMSFEGQLDVQNVNMEGDALVQPISKLNGELQLAPKSAKLESLTFDIGSSDITLTGALDNYMAYLKAETDRQTTPRLTGKYQSRKLNVDELINWDDTTSTPIPIHLPDLTSSVSAQIDTMIITGVPMHNLQAKAGTTPEQIELEEATVELFDGEATGAFTWEVPRPDRTMISFTGSLDSLQAEAFFGAYPVLGENSKFHEYVSGAFSAEVDYYSELNEYLEPLIATSKMDGNFGMTKSRLKGHPLQDKLASLFKAKEFRNVVLDEWKSTYTLENNIFTINDLRLTSGDIGMELNGTQHMVNGSINYQTKLFLPGRFKSAIASVITKQAADALTQENGTIIVPLRITGTQQDPQVRPDKEIIAPIVKDYLKNKAGDVLKGLFDG
ncbi:MAG: AsmA-like C-terminal region-containing protein [Fodinibius sp.]|nr:AsmA-like C-terminal region-containing protein [Fodinibius sp.]